MSVIVSIIGSSGRDNTITAAMFDDAIMNVITCMKQMGVNMEDTILQSGGSSFIDHISIILFLAMPNKFKGLNIYLPCKFLFDLEVPQFDPNNKYGYVLNNLHIEFSKIIGRNTFQDFVNISKLENVNIYYGKSFLTRNTDVAKCDYMIAVTRSKTDKPNDGGTRDCWNKCLHNNKIHIPL